MSKEPIPFSTPDISGLARAMVQQLKLSGDPPSHLGMLNMLARAGGFRNYQHFRAGHAARARVEAAEDSSVDYQKVERALHHFDDAGCLVRWPSKRHVQELCLWVMWSRLPAEQTLHERDVNGVLDKAHRFDDAAILRRSLIGMQVLARKLDGSDYRRIETAPPAEAQVLIREITARF